MYHIYYFLSYSPARGDMVYVYVVRVPFSLYVPYGQIPSAVRESLDMICLRSRWWKKQDWAATCSQWPARHCVFPIVQVGRSKTPARRMRQHVSSWNRVCLSPWTFNAASIGTFVANSNDAEQELRDSVGSKLPVRLSRPLVLLDALSLPRHTEDDVCKAALRRHHFSLSELRVVTHDEERLLRDAGAIAAAAAAAAAAAGSDGGGNGGGGGEGTKEDGAAEAALDAVFHAYNQRQRLSIRVTSAILATPRASVQICDPFLLSVLVRDKRNIPGDESLPPGAFDFMLPSLFRETQYEENEKKSK